MDGSRVAVRPARVPKKTKHKKKNKVTQESTFLRKYRTDEKDL